MSSMCHFRCQRVTSALNILNFLCERQEKSLSFLFPLFLLALFLSLYILVLCPSSFASLSSSSPFPCLPLSSNLKSSCAPIYRCHPTHTRDATLLLTTAGDHLARVYVYVGEAECVFCAVSHYAFHNIVKRGNTSPFMSHSLCWPPSNCFVCVPSTQMRRAG